MKQKILFGVCLLFGLMLINSGFNKFFNYMPMPEDMPESMTKLIADPTICTNVFVQQTPYVLPVSPSASAYSLVSNSSNLYVDDNAIPGSPITIIAFQPGNYTITLTTSNSCGSSEAIIYVTAENCGNGGFEFMTYPNPATSTITIESISKTISTSEEETSKSQEKYFEIYNFNAEIVLK